MKISVVIPAHNEEKYISKCLESLINQDYQDFEIIVCLNVCTDGTERVVREFWNDSRKAVKNNALSGVTPGNDNSPVKIIKENQKGVTFARQTGTKAAAGKIVASADADTQYPKDWLAKIASSFQKNPEIIGLYGPVYLYDGPILIRLLGKIFYLPFLYLSKLFGHDNPAGMNFSFKKEIFDKVGGYDINLKSAEDVELGRRLKKYGKLKIDPILKVYSSARRFKKGTLKFFTHHIKNYFRFFIFKKPPREFEDVR